MLFPMQFQKTRVVEQISQLKQLIPANEQLLPATDNAKPAAIRFYQNN